MCAAVGHWDVSCLLSVYQSVSWRVHLAPEPSMPSTSSIIGHTQQLNVTVATAPPSSPLNVYTHTFAVFTPFHQNSLVATEADFSQSWQEYIASCRYHLRTTEKVNRQEQSISVHGKKISNFKFAKCIIDGIEEDEGTYRKICKSAKWRWEVMQITAKYWQDKSNWIWRQDSINEDFSRMK